MASVTEIYNLALDASGNRHAVSSPSEESREAEVCTRWYEPSRDQVLRAAPWASTGNYSRMSLLAERDTSLEWTSTDPAPGWIYAYAPPDDLLYPRHLTTWERFQYGVWEGQKAIFTNTPTAILVYTKKETAVTLWEIDLYMAIVHALAANITLPLQGKRERAELNAQKANSYLVQAQVNAANVDEFQHESMPDWITARGYSGSLLPSRYFHPYGPLISVGGLGAG